eukprot:3570247-Alexandrium_andersonii.AAC.1
MTLWRLPSPRSPRPRRSTSVRTVHQATGCCWQVKASPTSYVQRGGPGLHRAGFRESRWPRWRCGAAADPLPELLHVCLRRGFADNCAVCLVRFREDGE